MRLVLLLKVAAALSSGALTSLINAIAASRGVDVLRAATVIAVDVSTHTPTAAPTADAWRLAFGSACRTEVRGAAAASREQAAACTDANAWPRQ